MKTHDGKAFWMRCAGLYDRFMKKDNMAYKQMCTLMRPYIWNKTVLELATGTGLIAHELAHDARSIEATDYVPEMIAEAKRRDASSKLHFSVQDACHLPYAPQSFEVVVMSNALHIMPQPELALSEIQRVLADDGVFIAPTFTHAEMGLWARWRAEMMKMVGFPLQKAWTPEAYLAFLRANGFEIVESRVLKASFPLTYAVCRKSGGRN